MTPKTINRTALAGIATLALAGAGCGKYVRDQGRSPVQAVVASLTAASGAEPDKVGGTLFSDVITNVSQTINGQQVRVPTIFADNGQITVGLILKDPGQAGVPSAPTALNQVTFDRYRVIYRRADGRNTPGVDVPYAFDSAATFTVPADGTATVSFELVRHTAKKEAPLRALDSNGMIVHAIAEVQFFGRDQAGNEVTATGMIGVDFGNFGDPE